MQVADTDTCRAPFTLLSLLCPCHSPDAADSTSFDVQLGDIILTATDGLFDNMPDYMILQELKKLKVMHPEALGAVGSAHYPVPVLVWERLFFELPEMMGILSQAITVGNIRGELGSPRLRPPP